MASLSLDELTACTDAATVSDAKSRAVSCCAAFLMGTFDVTWPQFMDLGHCRRPADWIHLYLHSQVWIFAIVCLLGCSCKALPATAHDQLQRGKFRQDDQ